MDARARTPATAPVDHLPSRSPFLVSTFHVQTARDELVQYFAWGYLSRRELSEQLRLLEHREVLSAA
jgi:hypothetical protein